MSGGEINLTELMKDAESCARLSQFEEEFCDSMREKLLLYRNETRLSDKQISVLRRIEAKVYA